MKSSEGVWRRDSPVVISYAINLVVDIDGEGNTVETLVADTTPEATRMIRLAHGL